METKTGEAQRRSWRVSLWAVFVLAHGAGLLGWWWQTPKGFPLAHSRFWVNSLLPIAGLIVLGLGALGLMKGTAKLTSLISVIPGFWMGVAISAVFVFPSTGLNALIVIAPLALVLSCLAIFSLPRSKLTVASALLAAISGLFLILSLKSPAPTTQSRKLDWVFPEENSLVTRSNFGNEFFQFQAQSALITATHSNVTVKVKPLLTFSSRSPDGFWTVFANRRQRGGPLRQLSQFHSTQSAARAFYRSDMLQRLTLEMMNTQQLSIESRARLTAPIYSHLNSYCHIMIDTDKDLFLSFSTSPRKLIKIKPFDYPSGRPARMAYFQKNELKIVEAHSGEKGPFKELAKGPLNRGQSLVMSLSTEKKGLFQVELIDWSAEASTDLSPTAGWRLPMNAIEFNRSSQGYHIWISLAATSVGRGWDSVAHSVGDYRGRMVLRLLSQPIAEDAVRIESLECS